MGESGQTHAIYELEILSSVLDMPEVWWKSYIDFEIGECNNDHTRKLYERLLVQTGHVKVWILFAQFEGMVAVREEGELYSFRRIFWGAYQQLKEEGMKEEQVLLLDVWRVLEKD